MKNRLPESITKHIDTVYVERGDVKAWKFAIKWVGLGNATLVSLTEEGEPALVAHVPRVPIWEEEEQDAFAAGVESERKRVLAYLDSITEEEIDGMGLNAVRLIRDVIADGDN